MKKLTLLFTVLFAAFVINAQNVAINNDGSSATASAMLDVKSTTKGFMMPRVTSAQRTAIASPVLGLLVFDTDTKTIWAFNGTAWSNLSSAGGGGFTLPYENSAAVAGSAFKLTNSGNAIEGITSGVSSSGIRGTATANGSNGVMGFGAASNGVGVRGESNTGTGMIAYSTSGTGLSASSISGTGINVSSISGLALNVSGNLKIGGGNTNPSAGAVLTSDAQGNATWQQSNANVAFRVSGLIDGFPELLYSQSVKVQFKTQEYDLGNNYTSINENGNFSEANVFQTPMNGIYHFDLAVGFAPKDNIDYFHTTVTIHVIKNGDDQEVLDFAMDDPGELAHVNGSTDLLLNAGDKVYISVRQLNGLIDHDSMPLDQYNRRIFFSGHLVKKF